MTREYIFISYSEKDESLKDELVTHLTPVKNSIPGIELWTFDKISAGANWQEEVDRAIAQAKVAILLLTSDYLASNRGEEIRQKLRRRHEQQQLRVIPIIARPCYWKSVDWIQDLTLLPKHRKPVWRNNGVHVDDDLKNIAVQIQMIVTSRTLSPPESIPPEPALPVEKKLNCTVTLIAATFTVLAFVCGIPIAIWSGIPNWLIILPTSTEIAANTATLTPTSTNEPTKTPTPTASSTSTLPSPSITPSPADTLTPNPETTPTPNEPAFPCEGIVISPSGADSIPALRQLPTSNSTARLAPSPNTEVDIYEKSAGKEVWYKIFLDGRELGWIQPQYLDLSEMCPK